MEYLLDQGIAPDSDDYRSLFTCSAHEFIYVSLEKGWPLSEVERDEDGFPADIDCDDDYYANSLFELSERTLNSGYAAFQKAIEKIKGAGPGHIGIGVPDFHGALLNDSGMNPTHYDETNMDGALHFGFFHDAMLRLSQLDLYAECGELPVARYASPAFLLNLLRTANRGPT